MIEQHDIEQHDIKQHDIEQHDIVTLKSDPLYRAKVLFLSKMRPGIIHLRVLNWGRELKRGGYDSRVMKDLEVVLGEEEMPGEQED